MYNTHYGPLIWCHRTLNAFTLNVKLVLSENLGGNLRWHPMLNG